jgi:hypothetical protein
VAIAITSGTKGAGATTPVTTSAVTTQASGSIFIIGSVFQDTFVSATDSKGNTYTQIGTQVLVDTPNTGNGRVYYDENATGGASHTFSCAYSASGAHTVVAAEITGAALSGALDVSSGARVTSSPFTAAVTPTAGNRLLVAVWFGASSSNPATHNWSAQGFTLLTGADETDGSTTGTASIAWKSVAADGVTSYTASLTETGNTTEGGLFLMAFKELLPPAFVVQPTNQSTNSGSTATFTASASNSGGAITYQWQDNRTGSFTNVASGGTSSSYTTPATDATYQGRSYRVVATDSNGSVTSGTAQLNVLGLPVYLWDTSVQVGNDVWLRNPLIAGSTTNKTATMAITLDGVAITAAATLGHTATMAPTLADITTAFSGTVGHSATSAFTLDDIVFAASATVTGGASLTATMAFTLDGVTVASSATTGHIATMTATLDGVTITSAATAGHSATSAFTLGDISFASSATAGHSATSAITLDGITFAASATAASGISATLAIVLDDITVNSAVVLGHSATMAFTLDDVLVAMTATNSNAPPVTAVQDYFIEIRSFTDRRRI